MAPGVQDLVDLVDGAVLQNGRKRGFGPGSVKGETGEWQSLSNETWNGKDEFCTEEGVATGR